MAQVRLVGVSKNYPGGVQAVRNVSLDVHDKELLVLVGPSGCGKSTVLRLIAGLEETTSGDLYIGERRVNDVPPKDRDIAMVFQSYALYPHMSVRDNMGFGLKLRSFSREEIRTRVDHAAELLGLTPYLERKPKALSGGQRQRVALGRTIVRRPAVFLFDEPLSNLDAALRVQMRAEIAKLHRDLDATMVYVTHDQVEAMTMADRIALLKDGVLQQVAAPLTMYHEPANQFAASFIGSPAMNLVPGDLDGNAFRAPGLVLELEGRLAAVRGRQGPAILGVRPEDVSLEGEIPAERAAQAGCLVAEARVVEPMGNEVFLHGVFPGGNFLARLSPEPLPQVGRRYELRLSGERAHMFSPEGKNLLGTSPGVPA